MVKSNKVDHEYFPMFMMGKAGHTFVNILGLTRSNLHSMKDFRNSRVQVELLKKHDDTFLLHQLQFDPSNSHAFTLGSFFNRQHTGLRLQDLNMDDRLKKWITPLATIKGSAYADHEHSVDPQKDKEYIKENEFVAIAEGIDIPLYMFTYNIEMTQFVYTNFMKNPEQVEYIDKSLVSRHHCQFISHQIADEARLNNHKLDLSEEDMSRLIRNHKIASIEYSSDVDKREQGKPLPAGLESHDVYLVQRLKATGPS